jgi:hypothetical protein
MSDETPPTFDIQIFFEATDLVARRLALFRTDDFDAEPTENERLTAAHLIGGLYANGFIKAPDRAATASTQSTPSQGA